ncbi:MAG: phage Gp37/Gp68 family protein [Chthoniobacter sp.]|nr:phage Gp37/Gp68 family protein [Chthoniobacter sp.]
MAKNSPIEWTHHTFNPWWGCTKVSAACDNCYADTWARRMGHHLWGADAPRRFFTDHHWKEPLAWNADAEMNKARARVFCASMADVFEKRPELSGPRNRLWKLIDDTPNLDWLLLTKRPQNVGKMVPWGDKWPDNVWLGTTVEDQTAAEKRLPFLTNYPAAVRFLSCEPLLGPINLVPWFRQKEKYNIDWVIAGGESGHGARPMHPDWASSLLAQCKKAKVPFHFKQWGHWVPAELMKDVSPKVIQLGKERPVEMARVSKKLAGRTLGGTVWNGLPLVANA